MSPASCRELRRSHVFLKTHYGRKIGKPDQGYVSWLGSQLAFPKIAKYRNSSSAMPLRMLRTP